MKTLSRAEVRRWCGSNGVEPNSLRRPQLMPGLHHFYIPQKADERAEFVDLLISKFGKSPILLWITGWGIFPSVDRRDLFDIYCKTRELAHVLAKKPGFLFKQHEFRDAADLIQICALSLWDFHVLGSRGKPYTYFSHDRIGGASFSLPEHLKHRCCKLY